MANCSRERSTMSRSIKYSPFAHHRKVLPAVFDIGQSPSVRSQVFEQGGKFRPAAPDDGSDRSLVHDDNAVGEFGLPPDMRGQHYRTPFGPCCKTDQDVTRRRTDGPLGPTLR